MAFYEARDFMFCAICGTSLSFSSSDFACCPLCGFKRSASEIQGIELSYTITAEVSYNRSSVGDYTGLAICSDQTLNLTSKACVLNSLYHFTCTSSIPLDIRRELKIEPFVILESAPKQDETVQRAVVNESCPKCQHPQLEYYTKQLRSADEGQTVFYECPECRYKFSHNT